MQIYIHTNINQYKISIKIENQHAVLINNIDNMIALKLTVKYLVGEIENLKSESFLITKRSCMHLYMAIHRSIFALVIPPPPPPLLLLELKIC